MNVGSEGGGGQDFDLNLAPIIDCFTVLITYLLVSASFISLTVFDVGVAATGQGAPAADTGDTPPSISIELGLNKALEIKVSGGSQNIEMNIPLAAKGSEWDTDTLAVKLEELRKKWPKITEASLTAAPTVRYREVVSVIEKLKKSVPKLFLSS